MINHFEKLVLSYLGKMLEITTISVTMIVIFLDPIRGRPQEYDWLQIIAIILGITSIMFSVWLGKFLNAIKEIIESI